LLGAAIGSAVLIGALVVGDSVRGSLLDMALARLGHVQLALASNDRFFRADLAKSFEDPLDTFTAPAIQMVGTAATDDNSARANRVQVLGVDERFWYFSSATPPFGALAADDLAVNQALAVQLNAKPGDTVLLRVSKPSKLSRDAPVSPQEDPSIALRLKLRTVVTDEQMGRFSLQASQLAPFNAFVALPTLQQRLEVPGRANLLLAGPGINAVPFIADAYLRRNWQLADAELELRELPEHHVLELRTSRVFLEPPVTEAAFKADTMRKEFSRISSTNCASVTVPRRTRWSRPWALRSCHATCAMTRSSSTGGWRMTSRRSPGTN